MAKKKTTKNKETVTTTAKKKSAPTKKTSTAPNVDPSSADPSSVDPSSVQSDLHEAIQFLTETGNPGAVESFGNLKLPSGEEASQCAQIAKILKDYSARKDPPRPLSIAVFGPPGSGKSFGVEELAKAAKGYADPVTINLSQLGDRQQLSDALFRAVKAAKSETPLIFFDEFDAEFDGKELGWLKWFLAPMQDGCFFHNGSQFPINKSVFIFAGGTAERYQDFQRKHAEYFANRKGPDFISRLRGYLNVEGLNIADRRQRIIRRSLILQFQVGKRSSGLKNDDGTINVSDDVLRRLLDGGNYIHGARSLEALLDMCTLTGAKKFTKNNLPTAKMMELHISRGPMDGQRIGLSAGQEPLSTEFSLALTEELVNRSVVVNYGGSLAFGETLNTIINVARLFPQGIIPRHEKRIRNLLPFPSFLNPTFLKETSGLKRGKDYVEYVKVNSLSDDELPKNETGSKYFGAWSDDTNKYNVEHHLAWAISLFRMRVRMVQESNALVVIGGKGGTAEGGSKDRAVRMPWGRFPGVAEEVMLALAFNKPVYIVGLAGGAAEAVGNLMGLARTQSDMENWLPDPTEDDYKTFSNQLRGESNKFEIPQVSRLPKTMRELREYLRGKTPGTSKCAPNGLSLDENIELFNYSDDKNIDGCINLVMEGITRLNWEKK